MTGTVSIERTGEVAVVCFDNPPVNALSQPVRAAFLAAIEELEADAAVRAIVLVGAGRNFIAGADVREFDAPPREPMLPGLLSRLEACAKPVVAALHGATLGGGAETRARLPLPLRGRRSPARLPGSESRICSRAPAAPCGCRGSPAGRPRSR